MGFQRPSMELEDDLLAVVDQFAPKLTLARLARDVGLSVSRLRSALDRARTRSRLRGRMMRESREHDADLRRTDLLEKNAWSL